MGESTDKTKGAGNKAAGSVKSAIGAATGNKKLEAEGDKQQLKGEGQKIKSAVKGAFGDKV